MSEATINLNPRSIDDYRRFLAVKRLPVYRIRGREAHIPAEYAARLGLALPQSAGVDYDPSPFCFDYQADIARMALAKRKFAIFADCGLGKTIIYFEWLRAVMQSLAGQRGALIVSPLMVIEQTMDECRRWYGDYLPLERVESSNLGAWLKDCRGRIGITNYEALRKDVSRGHQLGALVLDESSLLKSHYGKYGAAAIELGRGLEWKLAGTGTPAPNDRIEYANHAVFLDHFPTVNSFLAKFFVNRGQVQERWSLKPHALEAFYRALSAWCIFLTNPAVYGWKDNCETLPAINVHIDDVEMTSEQNAEVRTKTGQLFAANVGGITKRSTLSRIAKGLDGTPTLKYEFIRKLLAQWPDKSTLIWCWFNDEQDRLAAMLPEAVSIDGSTPHAKRVIYLDWFRGRICTCERDRRLTLMSGSQCTCGGLPKGRVLISKGKILGFGLNLQIATKQIFSSLIDSYELYYQAIKRSNRYGSTEPLDVHIPTLDVERPMIENVLRKAKLVQHDTEQQERIFRAARSGESVEALVSREGIDLETFTGD